jgi:DNA-binding NtrC family response regulator
MTTLQLEPEVRTAAQAPVLFVATGPRDRGVVPDRLSRMGIPVTRTRDTADALHALNAHRFAVCIIDLAEERAAIASIRTLRAQHGRLTIVGIIDSTRPLAAAEAIHAGVSELLPWPFDSRDVAVLISNARDGFAVAATPDPSAESARDHLIAHSPAMREVLDAIAVAAEGRGGVLICGEPSTGREAVARAIHARSGNDPVAFVCVECRSASPDELETALFGVPAERLTSGGQRRTVERIARPSAVYQARGGTLFLKDLAEAPARTQAKLARLLRDGEAALPEKRSIVDLDIRLIAALDPHPEAGLADGRFRGDLYDRLRQVRIDMPPLRRRQQDIPLLAARFLRELAGRERSTAPRFTRSSMALLSALPWPGNGRELRAVVEALVRLADKPVIELDDVFGHVRLSGSATPLDPEGTLREARMRFEREWISAMLLKHKGRVGDAARALGIQRTNLYRKVRQLKVARALLVRKG